MDDYTQTKWVVGLLIVFLVYMYLVWGNFFLMLFGAVACLILLGIILIANA